VPAQVPVRGFARVPLHGEQGSTARRRRCAGSGRRRARRRCGCLGPGCGDLACGCHRLVDGSV